MQEYLEYERQCSCKSCCDKVILRLECQSDLYALFYNLTSNIFEGHVLYNLTSKNL